MGVAGATSDRSDLLFIVDRAGWDASYREPTGLAYREAMAIRDVLYDRSGHLVGGLSHVYLGSGRRVAIRGEHCGVEAVRPAFARLGVKVEVLERDSSIPLLPTFEPVWRCGADEVVGPAAQPRGASVIADLEWGTDGSGTYVHGRLTLTNGTDGALRINTERAALLDIWPGGPAVARRFTAWIEAAQGSRTVAPGASVDVGFFATSATAACRPPAANTCRPATSKLGSTASPQQAMPEGRARDRY